MSGPNLLQRWRERRRQKPIQELPEKIELGIQIGDLQQWSVDELTPWLNEQLRQVALEAWKQELQRFASLIEQTVQARRRTWTVTNE